jgi:hypothetical protein
MNKDWAVEWTDHRGIHRRVLTSSSTEHVNGFTRGLMAAGIIGVPMVYRTTAVDFEYDYPRNYPAPGPVEFIDLGEKVEP